MRRNDTPITLHQTASSHFFFLLLEAHSRVNRSITQVHRPVATAAAAPAASGAEATPNM